MAKFHHIKSSFPISIACIFVISGCLFQPSAPSPEEQNERIEENIAEGGYPGKRSYPVKLVRDKWFNEGQAIEILILAPVKQGNFPLILYFPGLGEHADGGVIWRENWAKAGYFVVSIQTEDTANALKDIGPQFGETPSVMPDDGGGLFGDKKPAIPDTLRSSDLRYIGREYSSLKNLKPRMTHLVWAYNQIRQKIIERRDVYKTADLSRVVLAGYEFGAQSVAGMIGENYETDLPKPENFKPLAAVMMCPALDLSLGKLTTRYKNLTIPVLSITSREDDDPYSLGTTQAFWENSSPGDKFQLLLEHANHHLLSGSHWSSLNKPPRGGMPNMPGMTPGRINELQGVGGPGQGRPPMMGGMPPISGMSNGKQDARQLAAVISVSTAFLDSFAKSGKFAQSWLHHGVHKWLKKSGQLLSK